MYRTCAIIFLVKMNIRLPKFLRYFPPFIMLIIVVLMIFIGIIDTFIPLFKQHHYFVFFILFIPLSFSMIMWFFAFISLMMDDPGEMKNEIKHIKGHAKDFPYKCKKCGLPKPYRAHHCSQCNKCFAKMDHHCLIIGGCVALRNQKTFCVFLFHSVIMTSLWTLSTIFFFILCDYQWFPINLILDIFGSTTAPVFLGILLYQQIQHILEGQTTLEDEFNIQIKTNNTKLQNFEEVFGPPSFDWIIPTPTPYSISAFQWEHLRPPEDSKENKEEQEQNNNKTNEDNNEKIKTD